jgi:uncharacterized metal-binding protein
MAKDKLIFVLVVGWAIWFSTAIATLLSPDKSIIFSLLTTSGYLEGAFFLREDLKFCYWGAFKIIWLPYQKIVNPKKIPIVNIALQLAYLFGIFLLVQVLVLGLFSLPNSANKPASNLILALLMHLRSHFGELVAWLLGVVVGNYLGRGK